MSTGKPIYYYDGQQLSHERFFKFKGELRVEGTLPNGERVVVPSKDVTTERPPSVAEYTKQELPTEIQAEFGSETKETEEPKVEKPAEEVAEELTGEPVEEPAEEESEEVSEFEGQALLVEDSNGDVSELTYGSDDFNTVVDENKLDLEAIDRVLNNEQKTHKGFSFELVQKGCAIEDGKSKIRKD